MHKYFEVITYSIVHRPCKISAGNCTELNIGPNKDLCGSLHPQHSRLSNDSPARMEPFKNVCDAYIMIHHPIRVHMTFILLHDTPTVPQLIFSPFVSLSVLKYLAAALWSTHCLIHRLCLLASHSLSLSFEVVSGHVCEVCQTLVAVLPLAFNKFT